MNKYKDTTTKTIAKGTYAEHYSSGACKHIQKFAIVEYLCTVFTKLGVLWNKKSKKTQPTVCYSDLITGKSIIASVLLLL